MSQSPARVGRPHVVSPSSRSGVPSGVDVDAVERGAGQLVPDQRVVVLVAHPAGLAEHGRGGLLPVGAGVLVLGLGQVERALLGLELGGLVQAAFDGGPL